MAHLLCVPAVPAVCEITRFVHHQRMRAELYSCLFSRGEAWSRGLPCLKNRKAMNLVLWAKARFYVQVMHPTTTCPMHHPTHIPSTQYNLLL